MDQRLYHKLTKLVFGGDPIARVRTLFQTLQACVAQPGMIANKVVGTQKLCTTQLPKDLAPSASLSLQGLFVKF